MQFFGKPVGLNLKNNGLGPAVITAMTVTFHGKEYPVDEDGTTPGLHAALTKTGCHIEVHFAGTDSSVSAGQEIDLFLFHRSTVSVADHNAAVTAMQHIGFRCQYKSMYGDSFEIRRREGLGVEGADV